METANRRMAIQKMSGTPGYMSGGPVKGSGGPTADKVPIMASNGEFVVRAAAVKAIGLPALTALNKLGGDLPKAPNTTDNKFEEGGLIKPQVQGASLDPMGNVTGGVDSVDASRKRPALDVLTDAAKTIVSAPGYRFSGSQRPSNPAQPYPDRAIEVPTGTPPTAPLASPNAATMMQRQVGNAGTGDGREPYQPKYPVGQTLQSPSTPSAPATPGNSFGDAASAYSNRQPINPQDQLAMDGIQARQDNRDANALQRMQYDQEVKDAAAINKFTADRGKSIARLAMEGRMAQDVRSDATTRYQSDNSLKGAGLSADASRYSTDMQRENNQGSLGVAQGRLANETATSELDNASKVQMQAAQRALAEAKTPEEQESAVNTLRALQGKYGKEAPVEQYAYAPGGQEFDPVANAVVTRPGVIFNKATGQTAQQGQAQKPAATPKAAYDKLPKGATYTGTDGKQYTKG